jgi:putative ABC transport system permease protein
VVVGRHALNDGSTPVDVVLVGFTAGTMGEPTPTEGRVPTELGEVAIDESAGLEVGDEAVLGSERYRVTGLTRETTLFAGMPAIFLPIESAQALLYRGQDLASAVLVGDGGAAVPEGFVVLAAEAVAADATRPLERSITSVNLIRILLWFVAAMIIGTMVYLSALERRRDVAVLKAVGASTVQLGTSIAVQGVLVALVAALIAGVLQLVLVPVFPLTVSVPQRALLQVPAIAVVVALVAGLAGLRSAVRTDPALAFSGPGS